ncbi:hypothetical protein GCM10023144_22380 [Pigmentiphaga soli]|uniref:Uncharacterized protein n=1 Tax=Pigmentiphaga soli TaxID=1007095 RepID=A0ABP8GZZ1_9BURK
MIHTRSGAEAIAQRRAVISPGTGRQHWGTVYFGPRSSNAHAPGPQATLSELNAHETIVPHFHGVSMFQLFLAGSGEIGNRGQKLLPLTVQFKDHHTAYGPITAGPYGLTFVALRIFTGNSEPVYIDKPGFRERLKPSKRRNLTTDPIGFSIEPVMQSRTEVQWDTVLKGDDEMQAQVVRLGGGMKAIGPDPSASGGYYVFVGNGSLIHDGQELGLWSMVVVENDEPEFVIQAGEKGAEVLILQYPRSDLE